MRGTSQSGRRGARRRTPRRRQARRRRRGPSAGRPAQPPGFDARRRGRTARGRAVGGPGSAPARRSAWSSSRDRGPKHQLSDRIAVLHEAQLAGMCDSRTDAPRIGRLDAWGRGRVTSSTQTAALEPIPGRRPLGHALSDRVSASKPGGWGWASCAGSSSTPARLSSSVRSPPRATPTRLRMYRAMWDTVTSGYGFGQVVDKAAPFVLAALAVAVPARAGLINIGGEGQIVIGATAAGGCSSCSGRPSPGFRPMLLMGSRPPAPGRRGRGSPLCSGSLRTVNEAISTLLLNLHRRRRPLVRRLRALEGRGRGTASPPRSRSSLPTTCRSGTGSTRTSAFSSRSARSPSSFFALRARLGLRAPGGRRQPEAARRAGLAIGALMLGAMLVGGALAGLAGMVQYTTLEGQLRPGSPRPSATRASSRAGSGATIRRRWRCRGAARGDCGRRNALQISSHLPGSAVDVLMALVLARRARRSARGTRTAE